MAENLAPQYAVLPGFAFPARSVMFTFVYVLLMFCTVLV